MKNLSWNRIVAFLMALACVGVWVFPGFLISVSAATIPTLELIDLSLLPHETVTSSNGTEYSVIYDGNGYTYTRFNNSSDLWVHGDTVVASNDTSDFSTIWVYSPAPYGCAQALGLDSYSRFLIPEAERDSLVSCELSIPYSFKNNYSKSSSLTYSLSVTLVFYDASGSKISTTVTDAVSKSFSYGILYEDIHTVNFDIPSDCYSFFFYFHIADIGNKAYDFEFCSTSFDLSFNYLSSNNSDSSFEPLPYSPNISDLKVLEDTTDIGTDITYAFEGSHYYSWIKEDLSTRSAHSGSPLSFSYSGEPLMYSYYQPNSSFAYNAGLDSYERFYIGDLPLECGVSATFTFPFEVTDPGNSFTVQSTVKFYDSSGNDISSVSSGAESWSSGLYLPTSGESVIITKIPSNAVYFDVRLCLVAKSNQGSYNLDANGFSLKVSYSDSYVSDPANIIDVSKWSMETDLSEVTFSSGYAYDHYSCFDNKALIEYGDGDPMPLWTADYNVGGVDAYKWRIPLLVTNEYRELGSSRDTQVYDISSLWDDDVVNISVVYYYTISASDASVKLALDLQATGVDDCGNRTGSSLWNHSEILNVSADGTKVSGSIECNIGTDIRSYMQSWLDITRDESTSTGRPIIEITDYEIVVMRNPVSSERPPEETEPPTEPGSGSVDLSGVESQLGDIDSSLSDIDSSLDDIDSSLSGIDSSLEDMQGDLNWGFLATFDEIDTLGGEISSRFDAVDDAIVSMDSSINQGLDDLGDSIDQGLSDLGGAIDDGLDDLGAEIGSDIDDLGDSIDQGLSNVEGAIDDGLDDVQQSIDNGLDDLEAGISSDLNDLDMSINSGLSDLDTSINSGLNDLDTSINSGLNDLDTSINQGLDDLEDTISGDGTEGDELEDGSDSLSADTDSVADFEKEQQSVLDENFEAIQDEVDFLRFSKALLFVQECLNMAFLSMGDIRIIYGFPLFLGMFFFLCSRVPGAVRPMRNERTRELYREEKVIREHYKAIMKKRGV